MTYHEKVMQLRANERRVFGVDVLPHHLRPYTSPTPTTRTHVSPVPAPLEHKADCEGQRVEATAWTNGITATHCLDCNANTTTGATDG